MSDNVQAGVNNTYLDVNYIPGGHRQHSRVDCWGIVKKTLSPEFERASEEFIVGIPQNKGYGAVVSELQALSKKHGYSIHPRALEA